MSDRDKVARWLRAEHYEDLGSAPLEDFDESHKGIQATWLRRADELLALLTPTTGEGDREKGAAFFKELRFSPTNHLGLGDVRLTIGQQEELLALMTPDLTLEASMVMQDDIADLLSALKLGTYARPISPHQMMREIIIPHVETIMAGGGYAVMEADDD